MFKTRSRWWKTRALAAISVGVWLYLLLRMTATDEQSDGLSSVIFNGVIVMPLGAIAILAFQLWQQEWIDRSHGVAEDV